MFCLKIGILPFAGPLVCRTEAKKEKFMPKIPTLLEMLGAGVHFGHKTAKWDPRMKPYIFGERNDVHIINLETTVKKLEEALDFIKKITSGGGVILFVGAKDQAKEIVKKYAIDCGMPYVISRWLGGTFTNFKTIKGVIDKFKDLKTKQEAGALAKYTKKEQLNFQKEIEKLRELVGGIETLSKLPEAIFVVDIKAEKTAVAEARKKKVKIVALCDSNVNPNEVDYIIPSNDDAVKAIDLMVGLAAEAAKEGRVEYETKKSVEKPVEKPAAEKLKVEEKKEDKK